VTLHSYVGTKTTLKGNFECNEDFLIEGTVEGSLRSEGTIVLGRDAMVRGEVSAREVAISGVVVGTIRCSERLDVFKSAKIAGTIQAPVLKMEPGAKVNCRIIMSLLEEIELIPDAADESLSSEVEAHH
jgi:cytoskeletal protein CcmA (bactofilin family)